MPAAAVPNDSEASQPLHFTKTAPAQQPSGCSLAVARNSTTFQIEIERTILPNLQYPYLCKPLANTTIQNPKSEIQNPKSEIRNHSCLNDSTGLARAAFHVSKPTVINVMNARKSNPTMNTKGDRGVWYTNRSSHFEARR
jgi:hypothetical protein